MVDHLGSKSSNVKVSAHLNDPKIIDHNFLAQFKISAEIDSFTFEQLFDDKNLIYKAQYPQ